MRNGGSRRRPSSRAILGAWRPFEPCCTLGDKRARPAKPPPVASAGVAASPRCRRLASPPRPPPRPPQRRHRRTRRHGAMAGTGAERPPRANGGGEALRRAAREAAVASAPDLLWVARRAPAPREAVPEGASAVPFRALAGRLLSPAEARRLGKRRRRRNPKAWTRATAVAAFAGQNGTELSCAATALLDARFRRPGCRRRVTAARWPDARETSLVPESYLQKHDFRVVASTAYEDASDGELSFAAGETLVVRTGVLPSRGWWLACVRGRRGYAPRHILDDEWRQQAARNVAAI